MTDEQKLTYLITILKEFAEMKHCYEYEKDYTPRSGSYDNAFDDGTEFGEILSARTLLEAIGVEFEYPVMKEND